MPDRRGPSGGGGRRYPRSLRVNELLREVIAEELREIDDVRLRLATVTGVQCEPDFRNAVVLMDSIDEPMAEALEEIRPALQAAIGSQVRLKRTPRLKFEADPAIESGERVEEILRSLPPAVERADEEEGADDTAGAAEDEEDR